MRDPSAFSLKNRSGPIQDCATPLMTRTSLVNANPISQYKKNSKVKKTQLTLRSQYKCSALKNRDRNDVCSIGYIQGDKTIIRVKKKLRCKDLTFTGPSITFVDGSHQQDRSQGALP
jgi:hypothetical protein